MAFQPRQAPDYQGAASNISQMFARKGKGFLTWAQAKRDRDERRSAIEVQRGRENRALVMDTLKEAGRIGAAERRAESDKAERDRNFRAKLPSLATDYWKAENYSYWKWEKDREKAIKDGTDDGVTTEDEFLSENTEWKENPFQFKTRKQALG